MPTYQYRAVSSDGAASYGTLEAATRESAVEVLSARGEIPIEVRPRAKGLWQRLNEPVQLKQTLSKADILRLTQELARLLKAGIQIERALLILIDTGQGRAARDLLSRLLENVRDGASLSGALSLEKKHFPLFYIQVVRAGELSGTLDQALLRLAQLLERQHRFKTAILSALIYPAILMVLVALTLIVVVAFVLPEFEAVFKGSGADLPLITKIVMGLGQMVSGYWWLMVLGLTGVLFGARSWLQDAGNRLKFDRKVLHLKILGPLLVKSQVAVLFRNLGSMIGNGVPLTDAFRLVLGSVGNSAIRADLEVAYNNLKEGAPLSRFFQATPYFPKTATQLVRVGEETGTLGAMIEEAATLLEYDVEVAMKRFLSLFSPILTLAMAGLIAVIIGAVLLGILSLNEMAF